MAEQRLSYFTISDAELALLPSVKEGSKVYCPQCQGEHELRALLSPLADPTQTLVYRCGGNDYLAAMKGRLIESLGLVLLDE